MAENQFHNKFDEDDPAEDGGTKQQPNLQDLLKARYGKKKARKTEIVYSCSQAVGNTPVGPSQAGGRGTKTDAGASGSDTSSRSSSSQQGGQASHVGNINEARSQIGSEHPVNQNERPPTVQRHGKSAQAGSANSRAFDGGSSTGSRHYYPEWLVNAGFRPRRTRSGKGTLMPEPPPEPEETSKKPAVTRSGAPAESDEEDDTMTGQTREDLSYVFNHNARNDKKKTNKKKKKAKKDEKKKSGDISDERLMELLKEIMGDEGENQQNSDINNRNNRQGLDNEQINALGANRNPQEIMQQLLGVMGRQAGHQESEGGQIGRALGYQQFMGGQEGMQNFIGRQQGNGPLGFGGLGGQGDYSNMGGLGGQGLGRQGGGEVAIRGLSGQNRQPGGSNFGLEIPGSGGLDPVGEGIPGLEGVDEQSQQLILQEILANQGQGGEDQAAMMQGLQMGMKRGGGIADMGPGMQQMQMAQAGGGGAGRELQALPGAGAVGKGQQNAQEEEVIDPNKADPNTVAQQLMTFERMKARNNQSPRSPGMCTIVIVDTSGSMDGEPLREAGQFIAQFINGLEEVRTEYRLEENVAIISVGHDIQVVQHLTSDSNLLRTAIDSLYAEGPSPLHLGMLLPLAVLEGNGNRQVNKREGVAVVHGHSILPRIILVSDGHPSSNPDVPGMSPNPRAPGAVELRNLCAELTHSTAEQTMCKLYCVPLGNADLDFLGILAGLTGGKIVQSTDAKALSRTYLHHSVVGKARMSGRQTLERQSVIPLVREEMSSYDETDVDSVWEIIKEGEPDFTHHDQLMDNMMRQQQQQQLLAEQEAAAAGLHGGPGAGGRGRGMALGGRGTGLHVPGIGQDSQGMNLGGPGMGPGGQGMGLGMRGMGGPGLGSGMPGMGQGMGLGGFGGQGIELGGMGGMMGPERGMNLLHEPDSQAGAGRGAGQGDMHDLMQQLGGATGTEGAELLRQLALQQQQQQGSRGRGGTMR